MHHIQNLPHLFLVLFQPKVELCLSYLITSFQLHFLCSIKLEDNYCHMYGVTIDGVWIGNRIYWTLTYPWLQVIITVSLIHTCFTVTRVHIYVISISYSLHLLLLGSGFQRWTFLFLCSRTGPGLRYSNVDWPKSKLCYNRWPVSQSVLVSSIHLGKRPDFYYCQTVNGLLKWGALFAARTGLSFTTAAGPHQCSHSWGQVLHTYDHILLSEDQDSHNLEGQVPVFISPRNRLAQLYPQALGSLLSPPMTRRATVEAF
jgi:hypothetical protein